MRQDLTVVLTSYEFEEAKEIQRYVETLDCSFTYIPEDDLYYITFYDEEDFDFFNLKCAEHFHPDCN